MKHELDDVAAEQLRQLVVDEEFFFAKRDFTLHA